MPELNIKEQMSRHFDILQRLDDAHCPDEPKWNALIDAMTDLLLEREFTMMAFEEAMQAVDNTIKLIQATTVKLDNPIK